MQSVATEAEFAQVFRADHAIIFIDFAWSGQAWLSAAVIGEWERTSNVWGVGCPVFKVRPDEQLVVATWMRAQGKKLGGEGGYGSLVWLRSGIIVDYEPYVVGAGLQDISRRTRFAFEKQECPRSAPDGMWDRDMDG